MSDAWNEIQALKSKQSNLRAKLAARRKEREGLVAELTKSAASPSVPSTDNAPSVSAKVDIGKNMKRMYDKHPYKCLIV